MELLGIGHLLDRRPSTLSGGEKQRVAIGRALLADPQLLLMDEPLASLDDARKAEIFPYIERLRDEGGVPIVFVSHSVAEIARLATSVVVLVGGPGDGIRFGRRRSCGIRTFSRRPVCTEAGALIEAQVLRHDDGFGLTVLQAQGRHPDRPASRSSRRHERCACAFAPATSSCPCRSPKGLSALNVLPGLISSIEEAEGASVDVELDCGGDALVARVTRKSVAELGLRPGLPVHAIIKSIAFDPDALGGAEPENM